MKRILIISLLLSFSAFSQTKLLLIGGGARPAEAMKLFSTLANKDSGKILIFPWASNTTEGAENIRNELLLQGNTKIEIVPVDPLSKTERLHLLESLQTATGIFFTGGDQNQLMDTIKKLELAPILRERFNSGIVFAGTSAGTAIMSHNMLTGSGSLSVLDGTQIGRSPSLGLLPKDILVDQHFIVRSRFNRLAGVTLLTQEKGLAIDEGMAVLIMGTKAKVIGPTQVMTFTPVKSTKLTLDIYSNGDVFDLSKTE